MSLTINGLEVASMDWAASWNGPWTGDVELMSTARENPAGRVTLVSVDGIALVGTVDAEHSGVFADKRHVRIVGGADGWRKNVRSQHYNSSIGVQLREVATTTAAEVGELVVMLVEKVVGLDFARREDVASQVFADAAVDWWVGVDGATRVGKRPSLPAPDGFRVLDWDAAASTMTFKASVLVEPGTVIVDERFGRRVVRRVEAVVSNGSVTGTLWVSDSDAPIGSGSEFVDALRSVARKATNIESARFYEYRVIEMQGDRVALQVVDTTDGVPDLIPVSVWAGISGYKAMLRPSSHCLVGFRGGKASAPFIAFYEPPEADGWRPVELDLDAVTKLTVGEKAAAVVIGDAATGKPLVRMTPTFATWIAAISAYVNGLAPGTAVPPTDIASTKVVSS